MVIAKIATAEHFKAWETKFRGYKMLAFAYKDCLEAAKACGTFDAQAEGFYRDQAATAYAEMVRRARPVKKATPIGAARRRAYLNR